MGGEPGDRTRRDDLCRQHRRRRLRDQPERHPALGQSARSVGVDDAGLRAGNRVRQLVLGLGRPLCLLPRSEWRPSLADVHSRLRHLIAGARIRRHRLRGLLRPPPLRPRPRHRSTSVVVPHRCAHLRVARTRLRAAGRDLRDLHRLGRRVGLCPRPERPSALALRHRRSDPILSRGGAKAAGRRPDRLRRLLQRQALRARRRNRQAQVVLRHDTRQPGASRPQRPERVAGPGQARRLHRR